MCTTNEIVTFANDEFELRTIKADFNNPQFVLLDAMKSLGLSNPTRTVRRLEEDEFTISKVIDNMGRSQDTYVITEAGLYNLILRSRKPEAKAFKHWITHEVLPSIRKTGSYSAEQAKALNGKVDEPLGEYKQLISAQKELIEQQQRYILSLKSQQTVKTPLLPAKTEKHTYSTSEAIKYVQAWAPELTREWLFVKLRESNLMEWGSLEPTLEGVASGILVRKSYYGRKYSHVTVKGIDWLIEKATGMTTSKQRIAK